MPVLFLQSYFRRQRYRSYHRRWQFLACFCLSAFLCLLSIGPIYSQLAPFPEIRGVWLTNVDSEVMFSPDRLEDALQQLAQTNFNTVYPTVWNWGYTVYPSETARRAMGLAIDPRVPNWQDWDVLADLVNKGHQRGLTVIPWFEFGFMTPADSELASLHPDWLTQRSDGSEVWQDGIYERRWLNPFKPEVQQFILNLILEVVTRYNIDGIQFDDHLGLPAEYGYDNYTVQLYRQEHRGQAPPLNSQDPAWVKWRSDKITAFMTQIFRAVKARQPQVLISVSPNNYRFAYQHFLQDWYTWERRGLIEELVLQVYTSSLNTFAAELSRPEVLAAQKHIPTAIGLLTGLKDLPVSMSQVQQQLQIVRDRKFSGVSLFFYESLWNFSRDRSGSRRRMLQQMFFNRANRPRVLQGALPQPLIPPRAA